MTASYDQIIQQGLHARQTNNRKEAIKLFKSAIAMNPDRFEAYVHVAVNSRWLRFSLRLNNL